MNFLKFLSFGCVCLIIPVMAVATILEKLYGTQFSREHIYVSVPVIVLWAMLAFSAICYILKVRLYRQPATFCLHLSLVLILTGALLTHLSGKRGKVHLRIGEVVNEYVLDSGQTQQLPFSISLAKFNQEFYPGTFTPLDFVSEINIQDKGEEIPGVISMNNILSHRNYRFYQSSYDADGQGSSLAVTTDPYGITVTYIGYVWLLLSIICFFFQKRTIFRSVLKSEVLGKGFSFIMICSAGGCFAANSPPSLHRNVADAFGDLLVYYNGRVAPMHTFAHDFTKKIYGKDSFDGLTAQQVVAGWFFYYDDWKNVPFIKIKGDNVKKILGISGNYASLKDFTDKSGYKLEEALRNHGKDYNNLSLANEKFNLISALVTGSILQIYPFRIPGEDTPQLKWYSISDKPEEDMPMDQWLFIRGSMGMVAERVAAKDWEGARQLLVKIRKYQLKEGEGLVPDETYLKAEKLYNMVSFEKPMSMTSLTIGILLFFCFVLNTSRGVAVPRYVMIAGWALMFCLFLYLMLQLGLRWLVSRHLPLSNGFETMQFMAWCCSVLTLSLTGKYPLILPFGFLVCGFTLLVSMMGESSPQITNLMPVLQSPLLSVHVMVIMTAYTLLAFTMLDGIAALFFLSGKDAGEKIKYLRQVSRLLLYPAVFLLTIGIFIGAVWANVSWGRYWGWDPKEVWALITLLVYALPLHSASLSRFNNPMFFHLYCVFAFLSVLITYFGVNFFLGGLHSYA